jgi:HEAT repeat protein
VSKYTVNGGDKAMKINKSVEDERDAARTQPLEAHLIAALASGDASTRLKAALAIGSNPAPGLVDTLISRCAREPDFYVRDMLTWALTRLPSNITLPRLFAELRSERAQARSQALHTLSKIKDASAWPAITRSLLRDPDDEVAQSAWRAAVRLVPQGQEKDLAEELAEQLGRGGRELQLSLSRALVALGEEALGPVLRKAKASSDRRVRVHASATERLLHDPDTGSELAVKQAKRIIALGKERKPGTAC